MIKKNGKEYLLEEKTKSWVLRRKEGAVELKYKLSKKDFPTFEDVQKYVAEDDIFV